jgi:hypothetical protein
MNIISIDTISIVAAAVSSLVAGVSVYRMYKKYKTSENITLTRKDTGKSITISSRPNSKEGKKLLDLVN